MPSNPMRNLSEYVKYDDYLKMEKAAKDFENNGRLKKVMRGSYQLLIRLLFFTGARISEIVGTPGGLVTKCMYPPFDQKKRMCPKWGKVGDDSACIDSECKYFRTHVLKAHHGIRVKDVLFEDRLIAIYGKNVKSKELKPRTVVIDEETLNLIKVHIEKYSLKSNDKIINTNTEGTKAFISRIGKKIGLPWISAHKFRHGHAIFCIQNGMDIRTLQQQLGHSNLGTTAIYLQFAIDDRKKVYDKVFNPKPNRVKVQCPSCGFTFKLKKNRDIEFEDKLRTIFD
ncbi:integrase [Methanococcoides methylutens]|uniref:Integrase n=1 Tax=Methanococcoides methylutens TaxID=2226 RepID=A0A099T2W6_METMT|nr:site-specific integrase [Methanococcoides methylutens]KGK99209.1 integrase [Methanococcoides methylutens]